MGEAGAKNKLLAKHVDTSRGVFLDRGSIPLASTKERGWPRFGGAAIFVEAPILSESAGLMSGRGQICLFYRDECPKRGDILGDV